MNCYNDNCKKYSKNAGVEMPEEREFTAFCSPECKEEYNKNNILLKENGRPSLPILEIQRRLKEMSSSKDPLLKTAEKIFTRDVTMNVEGQPLPWEGGEQGLTSSFRLLYYNQPYMDQREFARLGGKAVLEKYGKAYFKELRKKRVNYKRQPKVIKNDK